MKSMWAASSSRDADLIDAILLATINNAAPYMGPAYWIPAFWVPGLLVTHYVVFVLLGKRWTGPM